MKKVAIVYGGELGIATKVLADSFGFEYIKLPRSIDNFRKNEDYFPEEWCLDIKLLYADLFTAVEKGADIVIAFTTGIFSFIGPCRLPYVAEKQIEKKLKEATKKNFQYLTFRLMPQVAPYSMAACLREVGIKPYQFRNIIKFRQALKIIRLKFKCLKELRDLMRHVRSREKEKGQAFKIFKDFENKLFDIHEQEKINVLYQETKNKLEKISQADKKVLKIGLVGDLYSVFWEFPIFDLENYICNLFDVEIVSPYTLYDFYHSKKWKNKQVKLGARKYSKYWAGGSDTITIRSYLEMLNNNVDGIIQIRTFGCMPEEISSLALQAINKDTKDKTSFMILSYDDHSNPEGVKTRLEAFCNTLLRKKHYA